MLMEKKLCELGVKGTVTFLRKRTEKLIRFEIYKHKNGI